LRETSTEQSDGARQNPPGMAPWSAFPERSSAESADRLASDAHDTGPVRFRDGSRSSRTGSHEFTLLGGRKLRTCRNAAAMVAASSRPGQDEFVAKAGSEAAKRARRRRRMGWTRSGIGGGAGRVELRVREGYGRK
jgi:hypothetical protein